MIFHAAWHIQGVLSDTDKNLAGMLQDKESGRLLTGAEVREFLSKKAEQGRSYFTGCDNVGADGRCLGHDKPANEPVIAGGGL